MISYCFMLMLLSYMASIIYLSDQRAESEGGGVVSTRVTKRGDQ